MSVQLNQELSSWKDVLTQLRRIETTWRGFSLSTGDHATWTEAVLLTGLVLSDLSNRYTGCGTHRAHVMWCIDATHIDVSEMASFLSDAILLLRDYSSQDKKWSYAGFKHQLQGSYPFAGKILAPIRGAITSYLAFPNPYSFYAPYQFLSFLTHLSLEDLEMDPELEDEYKANEICVRQHHAPEFIVSRLRDIMTGWLRDFRIDSMSFEPSHGPGTVAELPGDTSPVVKYLALKPDQMIEVVFRMCAHINVFSYLPVETDGFTTRQAQIVSVPKSMKTRRVISKEPATLMYFQQGVSKSLDNYFRRNPALSSHICLQKQELQREMALSASHTLEFATVDLSRASDSVSYELVKRVFRDTPLYPYLVALRSQTAKLLSGKVMDVAKFAPMGSALCFPIQSLIFASIVESTLSYVRHTTGESFHQWRVYGDDIIVPDRCLADLEINLRLCGFTLNVSKTYGGNHRFRESCGCDAYDGVDVTPMKIGRRFSSRKVHVRSSSAFQGLIDMANQAYVYQFPTLRNYLIDRLINQTGWVPVFSNTGLHGLRTDLVTNYRLPRRWNVKYQRPEIHAAEPSSHQSLLGPVKWNSTKRRYEDCTPLNCAENIRYWEWLRLSRNRKGDPLSDEFVLITSVGSTGSYISKRWIVEPV